MSKALLITGATGKQGGALIKALLATPDAASQFTILAVTRNANSSSAKKLASQGANVKLVEGDLNAVPAIFTAAKEILQSSSLSQSIWGVFSVQVPMGKGASPESEEAQGKALVDAAVDNGVERFVYTSVDRHGDKSLENPTNIPHFRSKHNIERHLLDKTADRKMKWTVLRPVAFFENLTSNFAGKAFSTVWRDGLGDKKLQQIAASDIGWFAAQAFLDPGRHENKFISLAGDDISFPEADRIFTEKVGHPIPTTFSVVSWLALKMVTELRTMFDFFKREGYGADIDALRSEKPDLMDFATWLEKESGFPMKK